MVTFAAVTVSDVTGIARKRTLCEYLPCDLERSANPVVG